MPKVISDEERELTKQALRRVGVNLIKSKGLRNVTVDDLAAAVGMAKGSFYSYYKTKEELLYEVIKIAEKKLFETLMGFHFNKGNFKQNIKDGLYKIYLAPESIALYIQPEDIEYFLRKFPAKIKEAEYVKSQNYLSYIGEFFGLSEIDSGTLADLMDGLQRIASSKSDHGKASRQQSLSICVRMIAEFINEKSTRKGKKLS